MLINLRAGFAKIARVTNMPVSFSCRRINIYGVEQSLALGGMSSEMVFIKRFPVMVL